MSAATPVTRVVSRGGEAVRVVRACTVEVVTGAEAGTVARVDKPLYRIGSHETNDLVLRDATVSKHHIELSVTPEGYRLSDPGSSNGTFIGTMRVQSATIVEPVVLRLGTTTVRLEPTSEEVEVPASTRSRFGSLVGGSLAMRELFAELETVAKSDCWLLIEGETGVGKERVAESVHRESARASGPFVVVDCGALVGELMEAELFGHVRGAFTGAERDRQGLLEQADGGTVFLDEIGELPLALQARLLGALGRQKVTPVGSNKARAIDVRVIAATHRDLAREVKEGRFRADLYYRLAAVRLRVPPLRERLEDIPMLVELFLGELRHRHGGAIPPALSAIALAHLAAEPWPGNVRELRNAVERAVLRLRSTPATATSVPADRPFFTARSQALEDFERRYFANLLRHEGMTLTHLARATDLDPSYLQRILKRLGLDRPVRPRRRDK